ncbi:hypothetical protein BY996DRAFT_6413634 [Phakopsora pachyrhizi]|nr:hypothetical protein BY996DRAFT_6423938 [Phakopsora pachyrhizi]KAI8454765.1 hypothetical protein BY996DRAFT_6413634 [Phakopsora pachyrhizi]
MTSPVALRLKERLKELGEYEMRAFNVESVKYVAHGPILVKDVFLEETVRPVIGKAAFQGYSCYNIAYRSGNISAFQQRATEQRREINGLNARLLSLKKILSSAFPQPYTPSSSQALRSLSKEQRLKKELAYDYYGKHQPVGSLSNATPQTPTAQNSSRKASVCDNLPPNSAASYCTRFSIASGSPVSTQNSTGESISRISPFTSRSFNRSFKPISNQSCSLSSFNEKKYRYRSWKLIKEESVKTVEIENYSNILTSPSTNYIACLNEESFKKMGKPYTRRLTEVHYFPENAQDFVSEGFPEFNPINSYETLKNFPESFSSSSHKPTTLMHRSLDYQASVSDSNRTFNEQRKFRLPSQANYSQDYVLSEYEPLISPEQYQGAFTLPSSGCSLKDKSGFISSQSGASSNLDSEGTHVIQYCESAFAEHNPRVLGPNNYSLNWSTDGNRDFGINLFNADRDGVNKASNCVTTTGYEIGEK